ncbi:phosphoesterase PA-phosphatase related protein [Halorubrum californiense DSM 19288]|uniref:Phosphoesterase PA-phosphatase related protein n=1 Tax=Halorubrum californiense DSM 19288 TaxID=1227465 RepID=M0EL97_9EURY|nr:phosphoesterase PA-phosphatase related protein [Halorubrum californiense DSM 19288]
MLPLLGEILNAVQWVDQAAVEFVNAIRTSLLTVMMTSMTGDTSKPTGYEMAISERQKRAHSGYASCDCRCGDRGL